MGYPTLNRLVELFMKRLIELLEHLNLTKIAAIAALSTATLSISTSAILVRFSELEISPYAVTFHRFWLTALVLGLWSGINVLRRRFFRIETRGLTTQDEALQQTVLAESKQLDSETFASTSNFQAVWQLFAAGILIASDLILWAWSLTQTSVANSTLLANLTPLFTCLGGWLIWGKCLDRQLVAGGAIAIGGIIAIGLEDLSFSSIKFHGDVAALLAAASFGLYLLVLEQLKSKFCIDEIVGWSSAIAAGLTAPIVVLSPERLLPLSWQGCFSIVSLVIICQILGQSLLVYSLDHLSAEFVAVFLLLDPILAAIAAWILFGEQLNRLSWLAFGVILVGIYIASTSQSADQEIGVAIPKAQSGI
jgi:drug/metabolite transporter (DMT)-like permease